MCAKVLSPSGFHRQPLQLVPESLMIDEPLPSLEEFGEVLEAVVGTSVSILGEDHIRISTPHVVEDEEIHSLREFIANSLYLPVTIFRERNYLEIMAI